jgi:hypothetical protein
LQSNLTIAQLLTVFPLNDDVLVSTFEQGPISNLSYVKAVNKANLKYGALFPRLLPPPLPESRIHPEPRPTLPPATYGFPVCWSAAGLTWLPYLPAAVTYRHPIFMSMSLQPDVVPVEHGFVLDPLAVGHWENVESTVQTVAERLFRSTSTAQPHPPFYPSSYGYRQTFPTRKQAKKAIKPSILAFHHVLAYCSYAVASLDLPRDILEALYGNFAYAHPAVQNPVDNDGSDALLKLLWSTLGEMHRARNFSGVVVSCHRPYDYKSVQRMEQYGVPVFVQWSHSSRSQSYSEFPQGEMIARWCPSPDTFAILCEDKSQADSVSPEPSVQHPAPLPQPAAVSCVAPVNLWRDVGEFLYSRYGVVYISEVNDAGKDGQWSAVLGLCCAPAATLVSLYSCVTKGRWPPGTCDLSPELAHADPLPGRPVNSPIRTTALPGSQGYMLSTAEGQNVGWKLIISDPLTMLQIEREGWIYPNDLISGLVKKGVPFRILNPQKLEGAQPSGDTDSTVAPGCEQPEDTAYPSYRQQLRRLFTAYPHTYSAALSAGGILWRIAMDVLPPQDWAEVVRPFHPDQCASSTVDGREYWTPWLTPLERDVIVGVYKPLACKLTLVPFLRPSAHSQQPPTPVAGNAAGGQVLRSGVNRASSLARGPRSMRAGMLAGRLNSSRAFRGPFK